MADGRKDDLELPRQQDQAEGEPEDVEGDLKAQKQKQQE